MTVLVAIILAGIGTYLLRASLVLAPERFAVGDRLAGTLPLVAPAVLAAVIASSLFVADGRPTAPSPLDVVVVGAALLTVRRTGSLGLALVVGLPLYWLGAALGVA